jgi:hypothetical protein
MNKWMLKLINHYIYWRFPEVAGHQPTIHRRPHPSRTWKLPTYLLTYRTTVQGPNNHRFRRYVRVTVNALGIINRISTNR